MSVQRNTELLDVSNVKFRYKLSDKLSKNHKYLKVHLFSYVQMNTLTVIIKINLRKEV